MATLSTLRCLARVTPLALPTRPRHISPLASVILPAAASFSTTTPVAAAAGKHLVKGKMKKNYKKKGQQLTRARKPDPGVRKAFRKRIQLSNNNALPVEHLKPIAADSMTLTESSGKVFRIPDDIVDKLRALEAFKPTQCWGMFRRPHTLLRGESVEMLGKMREAAAKKEPLRMVIAGDRITGKSTMLLQAMAYGFSSKWVVIHLPEGMLPRNVCLRLLH
jgi:small subunit ribosomal protein S29